MPRNEDNFLDDLMASHRPALEKYLTQKLGSPEDAAEISQEAFLRLHRLHEPEKLDNARAFLFQVATNLAIDQLRRRTLYQRFLNIEKEQMDEADPTDVNAMAVSPEKILGAREKLNAIYQAVDELPFTIKQAFLLHRRNGMSYAAIAQELHVSVSSVEKYMLQALKHCRDRLSAYYPDAEDEKKPDNR